jgi:hypothetical protein
MHKFHSIAALCGDGLRPELRALFERLAIDPHSGLHIRHDGMIQAGPDPVSEAPDFVEVKPCKKLNVSKFSPLQSTRPCTYKPGGVM